jgi:Gas vesicle protein
LPGPETVGYSRSHMAFELPAHHRSTGLVDVLDRVLDKGLVVAGDIKVSLAEVELLTIRIRLLICSLDKAQEIGLDWWRYDRDLSPGRAPRAMVEHEELRAQIAALERRIEILTAGLDVQTKPEVRARNRRAR